MSGDPVQEIEVGLSILRSLKLRRGVDVISCPTCARTEIDVEALARKVKSWVGNTDADLSVAVMGCVVNGIGEGTEADIGIAGTASGGVIFVKGEIVEKVERTDLEVRFRHWFKTVLSGGVG
jgi:(E)-4-hydroxy-3-methylbut-2-enyl-diphosphate synthase